VGVRNVIPEAAKSPFPGLSNTWTLYDVGLREKNRLIADYVEIASRFADSDRPGLEAVALGYNLQYPDRTFRPSIAASNGHMLYIAEMLNPPPRPAQVPWACGHRSVSDGWLLSDGSHAGARSRMVARTVLDVPDFGGVFTHPAFFWALRITPDLRAWLKGQFAEGVALSPEAQVRIILDSRTNRIRLSAHKVPRADWEPTYGAIHTDDIEVPGAFMVSAYDRESYMFNLAYILDSLQALLDGRALDPEEDAFLLLTASTLGPQFVYAAPKIGVPQQFTVVMPMRMD
jgi:hypothetical protein